MNAADYAVKREHLKCVQIGSSLLHPFVGSVRLLSFFLLLLLVQFPWKLIPKHDSAHRQNITQ